MKRRNLFLVVQLIILDILECGHFSKLWTLSASLWWPVSAPSVQIGYQYSHAVQSQTAGKKTDCDLVSLWKI